MRLHRSLLQPLRRDLEAPEYERIFAVDVSVWPRYDAETSPDRGFDYHPSRHDPMAPRVSARIPRPGPHRRVRSSAADLALLVRPGRTGPPRHLAGVGSPSKRRPCDPTF